MLGGQSVHVVNNPNIPPGQEAYQPGYPNQPPFPTQQFPAQPFPAQPTDGYPPQYPPQYPGGENPPAYPFEKQPPFNPGYPQ